MNLSNLPVGVMSVFEVRGAYREAEGGIAVLGHQVHPPSPHHMAEVFRVEAPRALRWTHYGKSARGCIVVAWEIEDDAGREAITPLGDGNLHGSADPSLRESGAERAHERVFIEAR